MVKRVYGIISVLLFIVCIVVLSIVDKTNNIKLSLTIQILLIAYLSKVTWGCVLYIKEQYKKQKYSYSIIMNLGLIIFLIINIFRQINLLIIDWDLTSINDLYNNTLNSFSFFAILTVPFIIALSIYSVVSNIFLIKKEGFSFSNLLGIIFGITNVIFTFAGQIVYTITNSLSLNGSQLFIKRFIDISLNTVISYWYCLILATLYCNIMAARHNPEYDKDFIIILGSQIRKDGTLTPLLKARVDRAIDFAKNQKKEANKDIIYIPSGGKGSDEIISESEAMRNYLIENGINSKNIIIENKSTSTNENMQFSKEKINEINKDGKIAFSTTNYHVFRSGVIANNEGIDCEGMGSTTKWYFYSNALIREFIANLLSQRRLHFVLISSVNIILFILVLIGYNFNLM